jgi:hypothetical protein
MPRTLAMVKKLPGSKKHGGREKNANSLKTGVYADLSHRNMDQRSRFAKALNRVEADLVSAIGGDPSPQEIILIQRVVYKTARCFLFEAAALSGQLEASSASDQYYIAWSNSL